MMFKIWMLVLSLAFGQKNLVEKNFEGTSKEIQNPVLAKKQILDEAIEKVSEEMIKGIIGESKYARNRLVIQQKVLKNSLKFIPFSKTSEPVVENDQVKMSVQMKVSLEDLQALLLEQGLFYEMDSTPSILPFVQVVDQVKAQGFRWWRDVDGTEIPANKAILAKFAKTIEDQMHHSFWKNQFFVLRPLEMHLARNPQVELRKDFLSIEDMQKVANDMQSQIFVDTHLTFQQGKERKEGYQMILEMAAIQTVNGREVAQVRRTLETEPGSLEVLMQKKLKEVLEPALNDLSSQVLEVWQKGAIGANTYRLTVKGSLPPSQQELIKQQVRGKALEVKNISERWMQAQSISYELQTTSSLEELAQKLGVIELTTLKLQLESKTDHELIYRVIR